MLIKFLVWTETIYSFVIVLSMKTWKKKHPQKLLIFFSVLPIGPKPAQISISVFHNNCSPRDLCIMTLSPGSAQSSSTLVAKKCNLNQNQTNSANSRTGIDSSRDLDCADGPLLRGRGGGTHGAAGNASAPPDFSRYS